MQGYSKDPVCGMQVNIEQADFDKMKLEKDGQTYYFCSSQCKAEFEEKPEQFIKKSRGAKA